MKSLTINLDDSGLVISHIGLKDHEVIGVLISAVWDTELRLKLAWGSQITKEVTTDGTTSDGGDESACDNG